MEPNWLFSRTQSRPFALRCSPKRLAVYLQVENFPQAELYFSRLINLKKDPVYYSNLGAALYQQQRLIEAAEAYENAICHGRQTCRTHANLARLLWAWR